MSLIYPICFLRNCSEREVLASKNSFYGRPQFRQVLVGMATCHYQLTTIKNRERILLKSTQLT